MSSHDFAPNHTTDTVKTVRYAYEGELHRKFIAAMLDMQVHRQIRTRGRAFVSCSLRVLGHNSSRRGFDLQVRPLVVTAHAGFCRMAHKSSVGWRRGFLDMLQVCWAVGV